MPDDAREFAGRVVLVTGGGGAGIGEPTARRFAEEGASLAICDVHERRNREAAERIRKETGARVLDFTLDIADRTAVDDMIEHTVRVLGPVDVLVCNAAENKLGKMVDYDPADWDRTLDVSLTANFYLARRVLPSMVERRRGNIVMISSIAGWVGDPNEESGEPAYAAAKAGLFALTRNIAHEVGPFGVRCNAVAPGLIWTKFVARYQAQFEPLKARTPLRRFGTSQDVVEAILFLASDRRSGFITGEALCVSGGFYMRP
jgi:NAD(P)-dependent dehydrogenase (short-subunit alcohol dehydrogenase family)